MAPTLTELSSELLLLVTDQLDADSLLTLERVSRQLRKLLHTVVDARCKHECFTTYLYPTISTYRMLAAVPETWRELYLSFSKLPHLRWSACKTAGTPSSLRALKSDNQEYEVDHDAQFLLRSGGHYWFSVLQTRLEHATLAASAATEALESSSSSNSNNNTTDAGLAFLHATSRTIRLGKWNKIRASGTAPSPRRHHSMTCLPDALCNANQLIATDSNATTLQSVDRSSTDCLVSIRRVLFFGGQAESVPFHATNELHLLGIQRDQATNQATTTPLVARWLQPTVTGTAPQRRSGHNALLLTPSLLLISGGSDGTSPIAQLEVHLLYIEGCTAFRWSTPTCASPQPGRALHSVYRVGRNDVVIFGGRQVGESNGLLSVCRLQITVHNDDDSSFDTDETTAAAAALPRIEWSTPTLAGDVPHARRGHSTTAIGTNLLLFGGQDTTTRALMNDTMVLDVRRLKWRTLDISGDRPCPRRGFKTQFFGTSLVVSSGFVETQATGRVDTQLPDTDVYVLTIV